NSSWSNNGGTWTSFAGSTGQALSLSGVISANTWTLVFNVAGGYLLDISSYSFWRYTSNSATVTSVTINGITVSSGTLPAVAGVNTGDINVASPVTALSGTVTVVLNLTGSGSFRLDDFTLNGNVSVCGSPVPTITSQPITQTLCTGNTLNLSVVASNAVSYQWRKNGMNISAANSSTYSISSTSMTDAGNYDVVINGAAPCAFTTSEVAIITVNETPSAITISPLSASICVGAVQTLSASGGNVSNMVAISENFNGTSTFSQTNNSSGGTIANAAWTTQIDGYTYSSTTFRSNDNSKFIMSNSDYQGSGGITATILTSPSFSLANFTSATLKFYQYYRFNGSETAKVEISTDNGSNWTTLTTYTSSQGTSSNFLLTNISLSSYLGQSSIQIRFKYDATYDYYWAIDNFSVSGASRPISWSPIDGLYTDAGATIAYTGTNSATVYAKPSISTTYTATAANGSCTSGNTVVVDVNAFPSAPTVSVTDPTCLSANGSIEITSDITGLTFSTNGVDYEAYTAPYTVAAGVAYSITAKNASGCVSEAATGTMGAQPAGPDAPIVGTITQPTCATATGSVELSGLPTEAWTINPGAITGSSATQTITNLTAGATYNFTVTLDAGCTSTASEVVINNIPDAPTANAGPNAGAGQDVAYLLTGSATNYASVQWTMVTPATGGSFSNTGILNPTFTTSLTGNITLRLTVFGFDGCGDISDDIVLVVFPTKPITWIGGTSNWSTAGNWLPAVVPGAETDIFIPSDAPHFPTVSVAGAVCNNITIASGGSLIDNGNLTVYGTVTVKHAPIAANEWHFISSPVAGANSGMFYGDYLRSFAASGNTYTPITSTTDELIGMKGYALYPKTTFNADYIGSGLNPASINFSISTATDGWNLIGNPYTSAINWDAAEPAWTKNGIVNNAVYIFDGTQWSAYVHQSGINDGSNIIAPGQGFFVDAASGGTMTITNAAQAHDNSVPYFKNSKATVPNLVRLEVSGNGKKDEAVVRFTTEASAEFDGEWDAVKRFVEASPYAQLYTLGSTPLAINSLPEVDMVPVGIAIGTNGNYTIAATEMNDMPFVTLEDTETGIYTNLSDEPYTFDAVTGDFAQRFILHFSMLSVEETKKTSAIVYSYQQTVHINLKDLVKGDIYIYNIAGQLVATKLAAQGTNEIKLPNVGNYIVKVITKNNTVVRKVFIQ
ncbi:MAG TPA: T9SS type A sorting domain-containing protein, partial [Bacteroidia bacterium]|nr:T9SS type A sorting domain-containing protein [Bacteroidia bacterium]